MHVSQATDTHPNSTSAVYNDISENIRFLDQNGTEHDVYFVPSTEWNRPTFLAEIKNIKNEVININW